MVNKKENGVSLLALVVTIIVLIIIAGAVIANIRGNSGIINQSANADKKKLTSEEKEAVQWAAAQAVADETNKSGVIADKTKIQEKLNTYIGDADSKKFEYNIYGPGDTYINKILTADIYVVKFQNTGNAYIIDETGNVRLDEDSSGIVDRDGVLINPGSISINREPTGKYYELTITSNTKDYKVTCSDESVLDVKKDKNGKILVENNKIFVRGKELGKATILVETSKEKRAMSYVTVHQEPTSIELTASGHILDISSAIKSLQIKPTIYPSTANYKTGIKWTSSNNDIAVVDENGFVTGISNGDVTITATTENGKTATWNVTVISTPLSIGLDKENVTLDNIETESVKKLNNNTIENTMKKFVSYCNSGDYVQAYNMLTDDCKEALKYNDAKTFKEYYIDLRFPEKQEYSLSKWAVEGDNAVYLVTFNGDLLATGGEKYSSNEEYYTFVKKDNEYKINVNNYIYCENKNTRYVFDDIDVKIGKINRYSKYEEMTIEIKNNSQKTIAVTTNDAGNRVYLTNTKGAIYSSINSVLDEQDLILNAGETKEITVKFNKLYSVANKADKLIFPKIILDYEDYLSTHNRTAYSNTPTITVQYN